MRLRTSAANPGWFAIPRSSMSATTSASLSGGTSSTSAVLRISSIASPSDRAIGSPERSVATIINGAPPMTVPTCASSSADATSAHCRSSITCSRARSLARPSRWSRSALEPLVPLRPERFVSIAHPTSGGREFAPQDVTPRPQGGRGPIGRASTPADRQIIADRPDESPRHAGLADARLARDDDHRPGPVAGVPSTVRQRADDLVATDQRSLRPRRPVGTCAQRAGHRSSLPDSVATVTRIGLDRLDGRHDVQREVGQRTGQNPVTARRSPPRSRPQLDQSPASMVARDTVTSSGMGGRRSASSQVTTTNTADPHSAAARSPHR